MVKLGSSFGLLSQPPRSAEVQGFQHQRGHRHQTIGRILHGRRSGHAFVALEARLGVEKRPVGPVELRRPQKKGLPGPTLRRCEDELVASWMFISIYDYINVQVQVDGVIHQYSHSSDFKHPLNGPNYLEIL